MPLHDVRPLAGIRVTEISCGLAGAIVGWLLAGQGASVVRVRLPDARENDLLVHDVLDRDKRILDIDPESDSQRANVTDEIERSDVLVEAHEGALKRLGIENHSGVGNRANQVHLLLTGFPTADTEHRDIPAWEGVLNAACGLYTDVNLLRAFLGLDPVYSALPHASVYGAVHGAIAVTLALIAGEAGTPHGQRIEVPLASAGLSAMASAIMRVPLQPPRYDIPRTPRRMRRYLMPLVRSVMSHSPSMVQVFAARMARFMTPPTMNSYRCGDGESLYVFAIDHARLPRQFLECLGISDVLSDAGLEDKDAYEAGPVGANIRESANLSSVWRRRIRKLLVNRFSKKSAGDWEQKLTASGMPCAVVRSTRQWLQLPELEDQGIVELVKLGDGRSVRSLGRHAWVRHSPAPSAQTPRRKAGEGLLSGIRVIDFSSMIAGPVAARTLAEYGAEVIKVVSPRPYHGPRLICWYGIDVDQGKRSLLMDLKSQSGREVLRKLLKTADVVVHNFGADATLRLGLSPEDISAVNPALVVCQIGAFRGPKDGAWSERRGYDPVLQAASGVMLRYGDPNRPEHHGIASCIDYLTGFSGALAVSLGLLARSRAPQSGLYLVESSLAQSANLIQAPFAIDVEQDKEPCGQLARGEHALNRLYRTRNGWIFLAAPATELSVIAAAAEVDLPSPADIRNSRIERALERALSKREARYWRDRLSGDRVAVWILQSLEELREDWVAPIRPGEKVTDAPIAQILRVEHPAGGQVDTLAPGYARLSSHPLRALSSAPKPGAHTQEILNELGYDEVSISRMISSGATADQLSDDYLPP